LEKREGRIDRRKKGIGEGRGETKEKEG